MVEYRQEVLKEKVDEFDKDSHYKFSSSKPAASTDKADTYGMFSVAGNISEVFTQNGVPGFRMSEGKLSILYSYTDKTLNAGDDEFSSRLILWVVI